MPKTSFERETLSLACFQSLVHRLDRELNGERSVGEDLFQDRFGRGIRSAVGTTSLTRPMR